MATCEQEFAGKPVRWVAVVSGSHAARRGAGGRGRVGHPHARARWTRGTASTAGWACASTRWSGIADGEGALLDYVPFHQINYCDMVRVRIRFALHEVDLAAVERVDHPPRALFPNEVPGAVARRRVSLGEMFLASRQWTKAADQARIALAEEPALASAHALLGRALAGPGEVPRGAARPSTRRCGWSRGARPPPRGSGAARRGGKVGDMANVRSWRCWGSRCSGRRRGPGARGVGTPVAEAEAETLGGGRAPLLVPGRVGVLVFFRPAQERSEDTLRRMAGCEPSFAGKPVHLVGVVSADAPRDEVRKIVSASGVTSPILLDEGDRIYGRLELRQHPVVVIVDAAGKVHAVEPYQRLRYCEIVRARVRFLLGEVDQAAVDRVVAPEPAAFPNDVGGGSAARYVKMGDKARAKGDCANAIKAYDHALRLDPGNAAALEGRRLCGAKTPVPAPMRRAVAPEPAGDPAPVPLPTR